MKELIIARDIKHENIISMHEIYESEMYVHIVLEYIKGSELLSAIKTRATYSEDDAAKIMRSLLIAISCFHCRHVIHRDIKPENIIVLYEIV